jgi:D-alanine-D-alanine ligase
LAHLAEAFISGREFTTFIVGAACAPQRRHIYPPVERVFHATLPAVEQFLSFDRLWEIYERETPLDENEYLWQYAAAPSELADAICDLSWAAYASVAGTGYGRVDLRFDETTSRLYVLEVNSQCGLSEDEDFTSIGAILRFANISFSAAVAEIIAEALASRAPYTPVSAS